MEDQTQVNIPLLRKAVEWAEAEAAKPEVDRQWNQWAWRSSPEEMAAEVVDETPLENDYRAREVAVAALAPHCGTAFCIAGWVGQSIDQRYADKQIVEGMHVSIFAAEALGLDYETQASRFASHRLFDANNTITDVRRIAEDIAGERL